MNPCKAIIFAALAVESRAIRRALIPTDGTIELHTVGIRATRLPRESLVRGASGIIMAGLAGALDPALQIGDVIIDDPENRVPSSTGFRRGLIVTAEKIVSTPADKAELFRQTKALAVEMEGTVVRAFAAKLGVPLISVRAISDTAAEVLDPAVVGFVDDVGKVRPLKLTAGLIRRPDLIPYLNRLGKNSRLAAEQLGLAVRKVVEALAKG